MPQRDTPLKNALRDFLQSRDLRVSEIPRAATKTPDLFVEEGAPDAVLIEIKQKTHDPKELDSYFQQMDQGGLATRSRATGYRNRLDGIVGEGVRQFTAKDPSRSHLHVMWIHCEGYDSYLHELQLRATIYGTQKLVSTNHPNVITCYYFWNSSFYRHAPDLDGVILSRGDQAQLLLNDHSPRFKAIQQSKFATTFGTAEFSPQQYLLADDVMVCDHVQSRESEVPTLAYLRAKYGLSHLQTIDMGLYEGVAPLPPWGADRGRV
jgi:hypothetical protein